MPAWIQYNLGRVYKLQDMTVWNSNQRVESFIGFGAKNTTIEYSLDGQTWTTLCTVEIPRDAPGWMATTGLMDMAGVEAEVRQATIDGLWVGHPAGRPERGPLHVDSRSWPASPSPPMGRIGASLDAGLNWRPGREAVSHKVYLSADRQAVADGTALVVP